MNNYLFYICLIFLTQSCQKKTKNCNCLITSSKDISSKSSNFPFIELSEIKYTSDTLNITGFIAKPKHMEPNQKFPLIIFNRGGNKDYGVITKSNVQYLEYLSSLGYVVMASQYRGNSYSEGIDELGGKDLNDVKCLIEIAKSTTYVDTNNIGVLGYSRGGLMAYLLSKDSDEIKTLITVGAPTDLLLGSKNRPELYNQVLNKLIGDSISKREEFIKRSPLYWFDQLNEPMLIIHGSDDKKVNIEHSKRLMDSLEKSPNKITPLFIEGGNHSLSNYRQTRNDTIANWFHYYLKGNKN